MNVNQKKFDTYENIRNTVETEGLYYELMQDSVEKPVELQNKEHVAKHLRLHASEPSKFIESIILVSRVFIHSYFGYYRRYRKITGIVLKKRKPLEPKDSLKFSIGLDFLKKNTVEYCLEQFSKVKNRKGLIKCFQYLADGREIFCKYLNYESNYKGQMVVCSISKKTYRSLLLENDQISIAKIECIKDTYDIDSIKGKWVLKTKEQIKL